MRRRLASAVALPLIGILSGDGPVVVAIQAADQLKPSVGIGQTGLVDQDGKSVSLEFFAGQVLVLNFVFTRCASACPTQMKALQTVSLGLSQKIRSQVQFVSMSVDPNYDSPRILKEYAASMGLNSQAWTFLTGSQAAVDSFLEKAGVSREASTEGISGHDLAVFLINRQGDLVQKYRGSSVDVKRLANEITIVASMSIGTSSERTR